MFLYADVTAFFICAKSIDIMNRELNGVMREIFKWLQTNFLTLNISKTKSMLFGTQAKLCHIELTLQVTINNIAIL